VARDTGEPAVSIEVRPCDFIGMEFQNKVGAADIPGRITVARIGPIDHNRSRRLAQNVHGMEIAVAQAIAIRHPCEAAEQELLSRLVEKHGSGDARCQPTLQVAELVCRMGMNASMQAREDLKILGYGARVAPHLLRE
jgi:hypothetical protein